MSYKNKKRFYCSQRAHQRLMRKHKNNKNEYKQFVYTNYHSAVFEKQKKQNRILNHNEKKKEFRLAEYYFFN